MQSKILVVDDDPVNITLLEEILSDEFVLVTALSGEDAVEIVSEYRPDLILLDIMMPGMNGYEVCKFIRSNDGFRHAKIVLVSAKDMLSERLLGYEVGADDYLTKPFDPDELIAKVRVFLRLKSMEEIVELRRDLFSLLSHETRTPLQGIIGPAELLLEDMDMDVEERKMFLEAIAENANALVNLLNKVTMISRLRAGGAELTTPSVDLVPVINEAVRKSETAARDQKIHIECTLPDRAWVLGDKHHLGIAVTALLDNAIKFSKPASDIALNLGTDTDDGFAELSITDHGRGIDAEYLPHVFEEFRVPTVKHHSHGHGLSLPLVREIVRALAGTIDVRSVPNKETTFTVRLPLTAENFAAV